MGARIASSRCLLLAATALAIAGCGAPPVATVAPLVTPALPDPRTDALAVKSIAPGEADLAPLTDFHNGAGQPYRLVAKPWTMVYDAPEKPPAPSQSGGCLSKVPNYTAMYAREFSYGLDRTGLESGHAAITVAAADSSSAITALHREVATAAYLDCYGRSQVRDTIGRHSNVTLTGPTTQQRQSLEVDVPSFAMLYTTPYTFRGQPKVDYTIVTWLAYDRYRVTAWVQTCCGQPDMTDVTPNAAMMAQRMQAAALLHQ